MDVIQNLMMGLSVAADPTNLLYCFIGVLVGTIIGALPGIGPSAGIALLVPLTFGADPTSAIIMLCGIYYGAMYGGSITSILINVPGDSASVMTTMDGYPMAKAGRAGAALGMSAFASFIAGTFSVVAFMFMAPALAKYALSFGPPEYFALMILGLTTLAGLTGKSPAKGFMSAFVGLFFAVIGADLVEGVQRFTFGSMHLYGGLDFIILAMGVFGIAELLQPDEAGEKLKLEKKDLNWRKFFPTKKDWKKSAFGITEGSIIGFFVGMLPGAGATIASFITYGIAKNASKEPELFGKGAIEGVAAPEAANNSAAVGAMVPMLTLGVPGSGSTAVMLGALMMLGLSPGPMLFTQHPDFIWGLIGSMYIGNILLVILCIFAVPLFVKMLEVPSGILNAIVMAFIVIGTYSLNNSLFDVLLATGFGAMGYVMKKLDYPAAPMVLALVLGNLLENSLRQSLIISDGSLVIFAQKPISLGILIVSFLVIAWPILKMAFKKLFGGKSGGSHLEGSL